MTEQERIFEEYKKQQIEEQKAMLSQNSALIDDFKTYCKKFGIELSDNNFKYIQTIGIVAEYPDIIYKLNKALKQDKEGLIDFKTLNEQFEIKRFASGYLYSEKYMAMAHRFFRRGHNEYSNFSPRFAEIFWSFKHDEKEKHIALDSNKVRINVDDSMYMELDTWYGAKFQETITNIEDGIVKLRPPLDLEPLHIEFFFGSTYSLDIKWYSKGKIKVFQSEEFKTEKVKIELNGMEYYPVKYVHSEFNVQTGVFRHFDGAIHLYTADEYYQRRDSDFNHDQKSESLIKTKSKKLFKLNGKIEIKDWVNLTSHFMTGNPLIFEYFEGKLPDRIIEVISKLRENNENQN